MNTKGPDLKALARAPENSGRRPYSPPAVERLGTLADLTRGSGGMSYDVGLMNLTKNTVT